jgi:hypothetical protein
MVMEDKLRTKRMLNKENGELIVTCNECGIEEPGGTLDFKEFLEYIKREGWKSVKVDDTWEHRCPQCQDDP